MGLKETFQKQGGMKLIKQYAKSGALGTAVGEFALLGKSRTALEILRLSTQLKTKPAFKCSCSISIFLLKYVIEPMVSGFQTKR